MKAITTGLPGYKIYEYTLVLSPHEELKKKIMQLKQDFFEKYKSASALYAKPALTIVNFSQYELFEERIISRLKNIAMAFHPIKVELRDFGSYPTHTIYINVTSKLPIQGLVKQVRAETQKLMKLDTDNKPHFILEPHLTIAAKLSAIQYEEAWKEFSHRHFTGRFIADAMLLLKREAGEKKYQIAHRFEFQNLPVSVKQGDLF